MRIGRLFSNIKLIASVREDFWQGAPLEGSYKILYKGEEAGRKILTVDPLFGSGFEMPIGFIGKYGWKAVNGGYNDIKFQIRKGDLESYSIEQNGWVYGNSVWLPIWIEEGDFIYQDNNDFLVDLNSYLVRRPGSVPRLI